MWQWCGEQQDPYNLFALGCQRNKWPYTFPKEAYNIILNVMGQQQRLMYSPNGNTLPVLEHYRHRSCFLANGRSNDTASPTAVETADRAWQPYVSPLFSCPAFAVQSPCCPSHAALLSEMTLRMPRVGRSLCVFCPRVLWGRDRSPWPSMGW